MKGPVKVPAFVLNSRAPRHRLWCVLKGPHKPHLDQQDWGFVSLCHDLRLVVQAPRVQRTNEVRETFSFDANVRAEHVVADFQRDGLHVDPSLARNVAWHGGEYTTGLTPVGPGSKRSGTARVARATDRREHIRTYHVQK